MKLTAVICKFVPTTLMWLKKQLDLEGEQYEVNYSRGTIQTDKSKFILVTAPEQVAGLTLDDYMVAPDYKSDRLMELVKSRVKVR